jgi:hypothetical protein
LHGEGGTPPYVVPRHADDRPTEAAEAFFAVSVVPACLPGPVPGAAISFHRQPAQLVTEIQTRDRAAALVRNGQLWDKRRKHGQQEQARQRLERRLGPAICQSTQVRPQLLGCHQVPVQRGVSGADCGFSRDDARKVLERSLD